MATTSPLSLILLLFSLLVATATARPCKTLFYFSTIYNPINSFPANPNPNFPDSNSQIQHPPRYFTLVFINPYPNPTFDEDSYSSVMPSSVSDRTMDIMSVVGALLFGVGCGALTAAIMYVVWAIFSSLHRGVDLDVVASEDDDDDVTAAAKKGFGYVAVPSKTVDVDDLKKPAAQ